MLHKSPNKPIAPQGAGFKVTLEHVVTTTIDRVRCTATNSLLASPNITAELETIKPGKLSCVQIPFIPIVYKWIVYKWIVHNVAGKLSSGQGYPHGLQPFYDCKIRLSWCYRSFSFGTGPGVVPSGRGI